MKTIYKIDVHHHIFPKEHVDVLKEAAVKNTFGVAIPKWTVESLLSKGLPSKRAIQVNIQIMLVFSKIREILLDTLSTKLDTYFRK